MQANSLKANWRKRVDICPNFWLKKRSIFVSFLVLPAGPLQALTPVNARVGPLARLLLFFTVTIMLLQIFTSALGIKA